MRWLRLVQGIALFMILVLIFATMYQLHTRVVTPLRDLVELAHKARCGDLTVRANHVGHDELGVLGHAFNLMAIDLSAMYANLEARVEQQTQALRTSNRSLELLYYTARRLSEVEPGEATYRALMTEIETLTGDGSITLCMIDPVTHQATQVFSTRPRPTALPFFCSRPDCNVCTSDGTTHRLDANSPIFSIPIKDQEQQFGVLIVRNPDLESVTAWQLPLLEAVARHIAATLRANEQTDHRWRLELLEERNAIARELHDSLAQSLAYLKIQVSRLHPLLGDLEMTSEVRDIVAELREGLSSAYRQLRELITTFRLKMDQPRLEDSLSEVAREFSRRGQLPIDLNCANWQCTLKPNEQIHVMHIVREALNNAVKHAHAHRIAIQLRGPDDDGVAVIEISDDGVGLAVNSEREDHFDLSIMRERTAHLGGVLDFDSQPGQGLRVRIRFAPAHERNAAAETTYDENRYV
jgi:two-component system nitrate/nitrite sensor histidine kinase NarX